MTGTKTSGSSCAHCQPISSQEFFENLLPTQIQATPTQIIFKHKFKLQSDICASKKIIAQKLIRLCDIDHLNKNEKRKIIILFRDPRGIYQSRKNIFGTTILSHKTVTTIQNLESFDQSEIRWKKHVDITKNH